MLRLKHRNNKAFTLIEFLIVATLVSVLMIAIIANVDNSTDKAKNTGVQTDIRAFEIAIHNVGIEYGEFTDDLNLLLDQINANLDEDMMLILHEGVMVSMSTDPWGTEYRLFYSKPEGTLGKLKILSAGKDANFSTQDDNGIIMTYNLTSNGAVINSEAYVYDNNLDNHICVFDKHVQHTDYVKSIGNCATNAIYYLSCECGQLSNDTFEGAKNPDIHIEDTYFTYETLEDQQLIDQEHLKKTICAGCHENITSSTELHQFENNVCKYCSYELHTHTYDQKIIDNKYIASDATCTAKATYYYLCSCGEKGTQTFESGEKLAHIYTNGVVTTPATCKATGICTYTCACGDTKLEIISVIPHTEVIDKAIEATCTNDGKTQGKHCSVCNTVIVAQTTVAAKGHTEVIDNAVAATCTTSGKTQGKHCSICNTVIVAQTTVTAKGHTEVIDNAVVATCTTTGKTEGKHCSACGEILVAQITVDATGHTEVVDNAVAATCTTTGKTQGKHCSVCNTVLVAQTTIAAKGHTLGDGANCTNAQTCTVCNEELAAALGHDYKSNIIEPTCTKNGYTLHVCSRCGDSYQSNVVTAKGHTEVVDKAIAATCTTTGKTEGKHCSVCNTVIVAQTTVAAKGHTEVIDNAVAATCTTSGKTQGKHCSVCNAVLVAQTTVAAKGHTEVIDNAIAATCTTTGKTQGKHCSVCNEVLVAQNVVDATGHTEVVDNAVAATCTTTGKTQGKHCSVCNAVLVAQTTVAAKGHTEVIDNGIEATCTTTGLTDGKHCSVCNTITQPQEVISALGHNIIKHAAQAAGCTSIGWLAYETCDRCTYSTYKEIAATGHTNVYPKPAEAGKHTICSTCGITTSSNHSYQKTTEIAATCTSKGSSKYTCECGYSYIQQDIPVKAHTAVEAYTYLNDQYHNVGTSCSVCNTIITTSGTQMHRFWVNDDYCEDCGWSRPETTPCVDNNQDYICDNCGSKVLYGIWIFKDNPTYTKDMEQIIYFTTGSGLYCFGMQVWTDTMDIFVDYYEVLDTWSGWDNKCEGTWYGDNEKVNFGTQPQAVSTEFFNWVMSNANREYAEVSGKWTFNTTLINNVNFNQIVNFSINVNGEIVNYKNMYKYAGLVYFNSNSDYLIPYDTSWINEEYMTIDFGNTPQEVFVVFYDWLTANATQATETETFYIYIDGGRLEYQYEPGMTFADFIESEYNDCEHYLRMYGNKIEIFNALDGPFDSVAPNIVKAEYPIDKDAYYGFTASGLKCDKYYVSGEWQFNDNLSAEPVNEQFITFMSNGTSYNGMFVDYSETTTPSGRVTKYATLFYVINYPSNSINDITSVADYSSYDDTFYWMYDKHKMVDFGAEPQEVSQEFYEWFVANAQPLNKTFWVQDVRGTHKTPIEYTVSSATIWNDVLHSNCFVTYPEYGFSDSSLSLIEPVTHDAQGSYYGIYHDEECTIPVLKKDFVINGTTYYVKCFGHGGGM